MIQNKRKWHQNLTLNGVDLPCENPKRKDSIFWNEGKWNTFIKPLLPENPADMTFIEIGCNAGLYLGLAKEYGFKRVIGVEADRLNCDMARFYTKEKGYPDCKLLNRTVGVDLNFDELPVADVVLLSNVHFYIPIDKFLPFIDTMMHKTVNLIIVSRHVHPQETPGFVPAPAEKADLRSMFKEWSELGAVFTHDRWLHNDPHPRELWSFCFKSRLRRLSFDRIDHTDPLIRAKRGLVSKVLKYGPTVPPEKTVYYREWCLRKPDNIEWVRAFVQDKINMIVDLKDNGLQNPIIISINNKVLDGGHRAIFLETLGDKSIIVRRI